MSIKNNKDKWDKFLKLLGSYMIYSFMIVILLHVSILFYSSEYKDVPTCYKLEDDFNTDDYNSCKLISNYEYEEKIEREKKIQFFGYFSLFGYILSLPEFWQTLKKIST